MENFIFCVERVLVKLKASEKKTQKINKVVAVRK